MSAALQIPPAGPSGQQAQPQITTEMIMQIYNMGEEEANLLLQSLPQLCQAAASQLQQGTEIQNIQQGMDLQDFQAFLNIINSPIVTDTERKWINQLDTKTLFEVVKATSILVDVGTPTKNALSRIQWTDQTAKNPTAKEIGEWILGVLMPRVIQPLAEGQQQLVQIVSAMVEEQMALQQGAVPGQGIGMGGPPQYQNQPPANQGQAQGNIQYPWKNSKGDSILYNFTTDATGKQIMSDSLEMDVVKDTIVIKDGLLEADTVMTAAMIQTYTKDGKEQRVLKDPEELKKACDAWLIGMPCTDTHPPEGIVMNQDEIIGYTTPPIWDEATKSVKCRISIFDAKGIQNIQDGKTDVSIGFFCDLDEAPGTYGDDTYGAVQRNIVFNHLATGLDKGKGRCPDGTCGIQGDYPPKTEEERAIAHFTLTPKQWSALSAEEKKTKLAALPARGSGLDTKLPTDAEMALHKQLLKESTVAEGKYRLTPSAPITHDHFVTLDTEGNGTSTENDSHTHQVVKMVVQQTDNHDHALVPYSSEEEPSMTDKEKKKAEQDKVAKEAADKAAAEKAAKEEPKTKARSGDNQAEPPAEKPTEKDMASQYVADMIEKEHTTLVDAIMDRKPPMERKHYEDKSLMELKEINALLDAVTEEGQTIPAGSGNRFSNDATDDAYAKLEEKLQTV